MKTENAVTDIAIVVLTFAISTVIFWFCWNAIFPDWVNLPALTYWRAVALLMVVRALGLGGRK